MAGLILSISITHGNAKQHSLHSTSAAVLGSTPMTYCMQRVVVVSTIASGQKPFDSYQMTRRYHPLRLQQLTACVDESAADDDDGDDDDANAMTTACRQPAINRTPKYCEMCMFVCLQKEA